MQIVHVIPGLTLERGGPSAVVEALTRHQVNAGHRVAVLTTEQGIALGEQSVRLPAGVELRRHAIVGPDRIAYSPRFAVSLAATIHDADILHVHSIFTSPVHITLVMALRERIPVVLRPCGQLHRYSLRKSRLAKQLYLSACGSMIRRACTTWHYTSVEESRNSWPRDDSHRFVLPNGIEPTQFHIDADDRKHRLGELAPRLDCAPYVLFLGRLHNKKRLDLLVESFLAGAPDEFHLIVAGPDEQDLWRGIERKLGRTPQRSKRVHRVGLVTGNDKIALLTGATLFALPSEHENFGIAALEALMAGTPTMLSPQVDLNDSIVNAGLGISVPLELEAWKRSFATVLSDRGRLTEIGAMSPDWVRANFAWSDLADQLLVHYEEAIHRSRHPSRGRFGIDSTLVDSVG